MSTIEESKVSDADQLSPPESPLRNRLAGIISDGKASAEKMKQSKSDYIRVKDRTTFSNTVDELTRQLEQES